ncbi:MAG: hypothetical protein ACFFD4_23895, partial [Candidatus Odinarchaeota archaeon]
RLPDKIRVKKPAKEKIPVAEGLSKDRKKVSKRLPGEIRTKKPAKMKKPPATNVMKKDQKKPVNRSPTGKIRIKKPVKVKDPPPVFDKPVPKARIRSKEPR